MDAHQIEAFALARDRSKALDSLIPGNEDHFFHACLVAEQGGDLKQVEGLLAQWNKRHGETTLYREILHRLRLLQYDTQPARTIEHLRRHLGLRFDHARMAEGSEAKYPSRLAPEAVSRKEVRRHGYDNSNASDLAGFTDAALEWLVDEQLSGERLRSLLHRVLRPDFPRLPELVAAELSDTRGTGGFGAIPIHAQMLEDQLKELLTLVPSLDENDAWVDARLMKLHPGPDADWEHTPAEREAFLERMWSFVKGLAPKFNALKAHLLWHRLDHDRSVGVRDRARFTAYLQLPRRVSYSHPDFQKRHKGDKDTFALGGDFLATTLLPSVGDDVELVEDYLSHFAAGAADLSEFAPWVHTSFLTRVLVSTKLLLGEGNSKELADRLNDPNERQKLENRVDLVFSKTNPGWFRAADEVSLDLEVKNVPTLTVKVFEINALNWFLATGRDVDTSLDLDGLVAGEEQTHAYAEPPIRRVRRTFRFPALSGPGIFISEFIGGGTSSRALIRKGRLRFLERVGSAGHVFTILDEDRKVLKDATLWLGGREYRAGEDGEIHVPFSTRPGRQTVVLRHGPLATLEQFEHQAESYQLSAGIYVDRESLIRKQEARVAVRPSLQVNGVPVSLSLLEDVVLTVQSTDREGVSSSQEVRGFQLHEDRESVHTFQVPEGLASLAFTLRAKVQNLSQGQKVALAEETAVALNGIDAEAQIEDLHLARTSSGYVVHHLGKSGEPRVGTQLDLALRHRDLAVELRVALQTDANGRLDLGHLRDITSLTITTPSGVTESWTPPRDRSHLPGSLHVRAGEAFRVPFMETPPLGGKDYPDAHGMTIPEGTEFRRSDASLLELRGTTFVRDHARAMTRTSGFLEVAGLPAGDYLLFLKRDATSIHVRVIPGEERAGWVAGERRHAERRSLRPLQITGAAIDKKEIRITLAQSGERTRVHVYGTRFLPAWHVFDAFDSLPVPMARLVEFGKARSHYLAGRPIGDEYRYILERRQSARHAGTMLTRPGLLLNPWAVRTTETATREAAPGGRFGAAPAPAMSAGMAMQSAPRRTGEGEGGFANLDFLAHPAAVFLNLKPDAKGEVTVPRDAVAHATSLRIVAVDGLHTVSRDLLFPEVRTPHEDLRLRLALDADGHFTEKQQISVLSAGQPLEIADITTSRTEVYDTLGRVFRLYATLSNNPELAKFAFILEWPRLSEVEKGARYSEFACHELSFFIAKKDPEWFRRVVHPYLRNKLHKTFLDHWLLDADLSGYRTPWAFGRLNVVERILLSQRFDDEGDPVSRHVRDLNDLLPRDIVRAQHLFGSAIVGSALEAGDKLGMAAQEMGERRRMLDRLQEVGASKSESMGPATRSAPKVPRAADSRERAKKSKRDGPRDEEAQAECADFDDGGAEKDARARGEMKAFYRKLDRTQEWAENNYWHLPIEQQGAELVTVNAFWRDYAAHRRQGPFLSPNLAFASRNFTEMMFALSVLDLPFEADAPKVVFEGARMKLTGRGSSVAFHKEIKPVQPSAERVPVLVSQNYFRDDDRTREENGEEVDKYVTDEFLVNVVYTCQVVLTNPTSTNQKLDLLLQIPTGSIPVRNGFVTRGRHVELSSYNTESIEYAFYFPAAGTFPHFPVHVARNEELIASAPPVRLKVVRELSQVDKTSWAWISQHGDGDEVLKWLDGHNIDRVDVELVAWRMQDRAFYGRLIALLSRRHVYNSMLWSYALHHNDLPNIREYLLHQDHFLDQCGLWLRSTPVPIDPVERRRYQHLEYAPLVNARTQKLGARREILNDRFAAQHVHLMTVLRYRGKLTDEDRLAVTYMMLLQDRIPEALEQFGAIDARNLDTWLQYEYLKVYADFCREKPGDAREIAERHKDHPVDRWRNLFRNALAQIDEVGGGGAKVVDEKDRDQRQAALAAGDSDFDFTVEKKTVAVNAQNITALTVNYYRMDIELLFSRQPFVQQQSGQFAYVRPNRSAEVRIPAGTTSHAFDLPAEFHGANIIVELVATGKRRAQACYAHDLTVNITENYGQLRVARQGSGKPLPRCYIKVYARMHGGEVKFYKDGYTDLRGAFDYASLSTNEMDNVERFAVLVMSEDAGAVIRECGVPKQ
ncbi:MAG: hypothetical protein HUU15_03730 [Candidatus Brocadiae bacterium]|nr:hypothetical protein [Candidatus Brocadiia bacterium]